MRIHFDRSFVEQINTLEGLIHELLGISSSVPDGAWLVPVMGDAGWDGET